MIDWNKMEIMRRVIVLLQNPKDTERQQLWWSLRDQVTLFMSFIVSESISLPCRPALGPQVSKQIYFGMLFKKNHLLSCLFNFFFGFNSYIYIFILLIFSLSLFQNFQLRLSNNFPVSILYFSTSILQTTLKFILYIF